MSDDFSKKSLKPFFNMLMIIFSLFVIVFFKMEVRRLNYEFVRKTSEYGILQDRYHKNLIRQARLSSPKRLEKLAHSQMNLMPAEEGQVILILGGKAAIAQ